MSDSTLPTRGRTGEVTPAQRRLDLLCVLMGHRYPVPLDRIMEEVPAYRERWLHEDESGRLAVRRMFERDKEGLRTLGIPVVVSGGGPGPEGYRIPPGDFYFPYLRLLPSDPGELPRAAPPATRSGERIVELRREEVSIALEALRGALALPSFPFHREAGSVSAKLSFDLPDDVASAAAEAPPVRVLDRPGGSDPGGFLPVLLEAVRARQRVALRYRPVGRDGAAPREVEPWGLLFQWGGWYLIGWDRSRDAERTFRLDRLESVRRAGTGSAPEFERPQDFDVGGRVGRKPWELGGAEEPREVSVHFTGSAAELAELHGWGVRDGSDRDSGIRRFPVPLLEPFLRWVLSFGGEARVVAPEDACEAFRSAAALLVRAHEPGVEAMP